jgi:hypothetical protein
VAAAKAAEYKIFLMAHLIVEIKTIEEDHPKSSTIGSR